jgi:hypothetical protein
MFKLKPINIFCEENITTLIKEWNKATLERSKISTEQHYNLSIGGFKIYGSIKWKEMEDCITEITKKTKTFEIVDIMMNLFNFCEYLDYIYEANTIMDNFAEKFNSHEILKISSNGSTRSASELIFELANDHMTCKNKVQELTMAILKLCNASIKISTKITDTELLTGAYHMGVFTAKILSAHICEHYGKEKADEFLDNMTELELSTEINSGSKYLPPIQSMLYSFNYVRNEDEVNTNIIVTVPNSIEVVYKLNNITDPIYAEHNGGIANVFTSMKINLAKRLTTITEIKRPDEYVPDIDIDTKFSAGKPEIIQFGGSCIKMERNADWLPFCGAKSRLLKINEMKEAIIMEKIEVNSKLGWNESLWKNNDIMLNNMVQTPNNDLASLIIDMASEEFNILLPQTDVELRTLAIPIEIKPNNYLMKAIYQLGLEETKRQTSRASESRNESIDRETIHRELMLTQLHHTKTLANTIMLTFRQKWVEDSNYDELQTNEAKRINFIKRLREVIAEAFDVSRIYNCYLYSAKNFSITNGVV